MSESYKRGDFEWVMVPRDAFGDMLEAGIDARNDGLTTREVYAAMIAAAPQQVSAPVGVEADDEYWTLNRVLEHPESCGIVETEGFKEWAKLNPSATSRLIVALFLYLPLDDLRDATANKIAALAQQPAAVDAQDVDTCPQCGGGVFTIHHQGCKGCIDDECDWFKNYTTGRWPKSRG